MTEYLETYAYLCNAILKAKDEDDLRKMVYYAEWLSNLKKY